MANSIYQFWDGESPIYTKAGEVFTPDEWRARYGWAAAPGAVCVVAAGVVNGAFCDELHEMKKNAELSGAEFADGLSDAELLDAIAEFYSTLGKGSDPTANDQTRIADALEDLVVLQMPDDIGEVE